MAAPSPVYPPSTGTTTPLEDIVEDHETRISTLEWSNNYGADLAYYFKVSPSVSGDISPGTVLKITAGEAEWEVAPFDLREADEASGVVRVGVVPSRPYRVCDSDPSRRGREVAVARMGRVAVRVDDGATDVRNIHVGDVVVASLTRSGHANVVSRWSVPAQELNLVIGEVERPNVDVDAQVPLGSGHFVEAWIHDSSIVGILRGGSASAGAGEDGRDSNGNSNSDSNSNSNGNSDGRCGLQRHWLVLSSCVSVIEREMCRRLLPVLVTDHLLPGDISDMHGLETSLAPWVYPKGHAWTLSRLECLHGKYTTAGEFEVLGPCVWRAEVNGSCTKQLAAAVAEKWLEYPLLVDPLDEEEAWERCRSLAVDVSSASGVDSASMQVKPVFEPVRLWALSLPKRDTVAVCAALGATGTYLKLRSIAFHFAFSLSSDVPYLQWSNALEERGAEHVLNLSKGVNIVKAAFPCPIDEPNYLHEYGDLDSTVLSYFFDNNNLPSLKLDGSILSAVRVVHKCRNRIIRNAAYSTSEECFAKHSLQLQQVVGWLHSKWGRVEELAQVSQRLQCPEACHDDESVYDASRRFIVAGRSLDVCDSSTKAFLTRAVAGAGRALEEWREKVRWSVGESLQRMNDMARQVLSAPSCHKAQARDYWVSLRAAAVDGGDGDVSAQTDLWKHALTFLDVRSRRQRLLIVEGEAGSGKSVFIRSLYQHLVEEWEARKSVTNARLDDGNKPLFPVLLCADDIGGSEAADAIMLMRRRGISVSDMKTWGGRVVFLMDCGREGHSSDKLTKLRGLFTSRELDGWCKWQGIVACRQSWLGGREAKAGSGGVSGLGASDAVQVRMLPLTRSQIEEYLCRLSANSDSVTDAVVIMKKLHVMDMLTAPSVLAFAANALRHLLREDGGKCSEEDISQLREQVVSLVDRTASTQPMSNGLADEFIIVNEELEHAAGVDELRTQSSLSGSRASRDSRTQEIEGRNRNKETEIEERNRNKETEIEERNRNKETVIEGRNRNKETEIEGRNRNKETEIDGRNRNKETEPESSEKGIVRRRLLINEKKLRRAKMRKEAPRGQLPNR